MSYRKLFRRVPARGFTLIEVMVVVVILAVLAAIVVPKIMSRPDEARVVAARAYLPPRQTNWLIGLALLLTTVGLDFSGYVLRWDSQTFWAAQVMSNLVGQMPLCGQALQQILLGGPQINESGLLRFYAFHCFFGPVLCLALIMYHFWRVRRDGKLGQSL